MCKYKSSCKKYSDLKMPDGIDRADSSTYNSANERFITSSLAAMGHANVFAKPAGCTRAERLQAVVKGAGMRLYAACCLTGNGKVACPMLLYLRAYFAPTFLDARPPQE